MAIKIIKEGKTEKFTKTCPYCGCEFKYGQGDIKSEYGTYIKGDIKSEYSTYIICPCCGKHLPHNVYIAYYNNPTGKFTKTCPCCGKHLHHNGYIAYYNNPNVIHVSPEKGSIVTICDNCPNRPNPKYTITGDSPCDWCIKRNLTYK